MSFFGRGSSSSSNSGNTSALSTAKPDVQAQANALKQAISQQIATTNAQGLIDAVNHKCFQKCVTKPSDKLGSSEEGCLDRCMQRYLEAYDIINRTYMARVAKERDVQRFAPAGNADDEFL
ncbi:hypothetical protein BT69DRAFT_1283531 [Atractiella rhizophila]|nr:hypothetical protein BT69DRAFT_1283531 [Atractiella rhizophila]